MNNTGPNIVLWLAFIVLVLVDAALTLIALDSGFYETNPFTSVVGVIPHTVILITLSAALFYSHTSHILKTVVLSAFGFVWLLNDVYSIFLLA